jgi:hypothetical protein
MIADIVSPFLTLEGAPASHASRSEKLATFDRPQDIGTSKGSLSVLEVFGICFDVARRSLQGRESGRLSIVRQQADIGTSKMLERFIYFCW